MDAKILVVEKGNARGQDVVRAIRDEHIYSELVMFETFDVSALTDDVVGLVFLGDDMTLPEDITIPVTHLETATAYESLKTYLDSHRASFPVWNIERFVELQTAAIKDQVKDDQVILALSGGVDSSVVAALLHHAIGDQLTCIFVNHGLLRKNEVEEVETVFKDTFKINLITIDAVDRFLGKLAGVSDPETKRKIIGKEFIEVFDDETHKHKDAKWLAQGTIYSDVIESGMDPNQVVKSHHNVGGLPEDLEFKLLEPLRMLFKDEVRELGTYLGLPDYIVNRQPFPGPGLAIRIIGDITKEKVTRVQNADFIYREEIKKAGLDKAIWQYFAIHTDMKSVGVKDEKRTYDYTIVLRGVHSVDGMRADFAHIPFEVLQTIAARITSEVEGVNRVVYDITTKPPGTIEWE